MDEDNKKISAEIERIKANIEALNEIRKANNERFTRIAEQIGELRSMIIDVEKNLKSIEADASKAIDVVRSTRPEKLLEEVSKANLKVDALKAKIDSQQAIINKVIDELKDLRDKFSLFRGLEEIMNLSKEMKDNIVKYKKLQGKLERDADRIESIFIEVNKKFEDFTKYKEMLSTFEDRVKAIEKQLDSLTVKVESALTLDIFNDFKKKTAEQIKSLDKRQVEINKVIGKEVKKELEPFKRALQKKYTQLVAKMKQLDKFREDVLNYLKRIALFEANIKRFVNENKNIVREVKKDREAIIQQINELKKLKATWLMQVAKQIEMLDKKINEMNEFYARQFNNFRAWIGYFNKRLNFIFKKE